MLKRSLHLLSAVAIAVMLSAFVGVGQAAASTAVKEPKGPRVSVVMVAKAPEADQNILSYQIVAANHSEMYARNVTITVPFKGAALKLASVQFSGGDAWVQTQETNAFVYRIEGLHKDHPITATVRFTKLATAPKDIALTERATFTWSVQGRKDSGKSNIPLALMPYYSMDVTAFATKDGTTQRFAGNVFAPGEPVSFWCNMPDGEIHGLLIRNGPNAVLAHKVTTEQKRSHSYVEAIRTNLDGAMTIDFPTEDLTPGYYSIVAYGQWSGLQAVGAFQMK
jgi:hypothetical protein